MPEVAQESEWCQKNYCCDPLSNGRSAESLDFAHLSFLKNIAGVKLRGGADIDLLLKSYKYLIESLGGTLKGEI